MDSKTNLKRVFARNCEVRRIDCAAAKGFLDSYHALGYATMRYRYGLFIERESTKGEGLPKGTLVAVGGFSSARNLSTPSGTFRSYEWVRYASLPEVRIIGGMGKILSSFIGETSPDDVMSYCSTSFSGDAYRALGFREEGIKTFPGGASSIKFRLTLKGR